MKICSSSSKTSKGCWRFKGVWGSKNGRGKRSQASKVLGTTMDTRCTAWLDQAQWGPGQNQPLTPSPTLHPFLWLFLLAGIKSKNLLKDTQSREFLVLELGSWVVSVHSKARGWRPKPPDVVPKLNPRRDTGLPLEEKCCRWEHLQNKKRLVIGHTHCGKRGCAQTATNPTHHSASSHLAMQGRKILRNSATNLETRHSDVKSCSDLQQAWLG